MALGRRPPARTPPRSGVSSPRQQPRDSPIATPRGRASPGSSTPPLPPFVGAPLVSFADVTVGGEIGKGRFKQVNQGRLAPKDGSTARDVVILRYTKNADQKRELEILSLLAQTENSSNFVPQIFGVCDERKEIIILQELATLGSLKAALTNPVLSKKFDAIARASVAWQSSLAMGFLESMHIVHADLSCRNLLVFHISSEPIGTIVKVTDFGLAIRLREGTSSEVRDQPKATRWCSPETVAFNKMSHASDVWSFGVTLWEMYSDCETPWFQWQKRTAVNAHLKQLGEQVAAGQDVVAAMASEFPRYELCAEQAHDWIVACLQPVDSSRPTFAQLAECFASLVTHLTQPLVVEEAAATVANEVSVEQLMSTRASQPPPESMTAALSTVAADVLSRIAGEESPDAPQTTPRMQAAVSGNAAQQDSLHQKQVQMQTQPSAQQQQMQQQNSYHYQQQPQQQMQQRQSLQQIFQPPPRELDDFHKHCEILRDFLTSTGATNLLGDRGAVQAFKAFLLSGAARPFLQDVPNLNRFHSQAPPPPPREPMSMPKPMSPSRPMVPQMPPLHHIQSPPQDLGRSLMSASALSSPRSPFQGTHHQSGAALLSPRMPWTLQSLVGHSIVRREEYWDQASAMINFQRVAKEGVPCMLRDPKGNDVAARAWVVLDNTTYSV